MQHVGDTDRMPIAPSSAKPLPWAAPAEADVEAPFASRRRRSWWRELLKWLLSVTLLVALAPPLLGLSLLAAIYWQARTDQARPVDAIVVLGTTQFNGRPSPVLRARLDHVLTLYRDGMAPLIVTTGGRQEGDAFTEAEASRDYLVAQGVPAAAIVLENAGRSSIDSMRGTAALLDARGLRRVLLVSDGFHLLRIKVMARDLGLIPYASPVPNSPIRRNSGLELSYVARDAAALVFYLLGTR